jgi:hypothetical protein
MIILRSYQKLFALLHNSALWIYIAMKEHYFTVYSNLKYINIFFYDTYLDVSVKYTFVGAVTQ